MGYYIDVYSPETFNEFLNNDALSSKLKVHYEKKASTLKQGDKLLCYVTKFSRFVGVLEITGKLFIDPNEKLYPIQLPIKRNIFLPLSYGIPIKEKIIFDKLSFTKKGEKWSYMVRNSLRTLDYDDGVIIENILNNQASNISSCEYPFSKGELTILKKLPITE